MVKGVRNPFKKIVWELLETQNKFLLSILHFLSHLYRLLYIVSRHFQGAPKKLPCKVISVGNITWGGTGKTPFVRYLVDKLKKRARVGIVTHGYGRKRKNIGVISVHKGRINFQSALGDETLLLARNLPHVPIVVGENKREACEFLCREEKIDFLILEDGFQYPGIVKDWEILLLDSTNPFGKGYLIPRGTLREPLSQIKRAHLIIQTKVDSDRAQDISPFLKIHFPHIPVLKSIHSPLYFRRVGKGEKIKLEEFKGREAISFSGIADPTYFEETLLKIGIILKKSIRFPDHYPFQEEELKEVLLLNKGDEEVIITTEKDEQRIPPRIAEIFPIFSLIISFKIVEGEEILERFLRV